MSEIASIKDMLIDELWLPTAMKGGATFYSRLKINKKMKMLTLTNHLNFREVTEFIKNKLTKKDLIVGWNNAQNNAWRLDSEGKIGAVIGSTRYEDSISLDTHDIQNEFPFDILNLDFSSQSPELEERRLEKEIHSVEHTINLQASKDNKNMVLIYTTLLDSNPLNLDEIKQNSDNIRIQGWNGLSTDELPSNTTNPNEKISCLNEIFQQVYSKHKYKKIEDSQSSCIELSNGSGHILSIVVLLRWSLITW